MSDFLILTVTLLTLVIIIVFSLIFLKKSKKKNNEVEIDLSAFEDRVLELISKFQHISATRLTAMENKIEEMNKILRDANEMYFRLSAILSDTTKSLSEVEGKKSKPYESIEHNQTKSQEKQSEDLSITDEKSNNNRKEEEDKTQRQDDDHFTFEEEFINPPDLKNSSLEHKIMNMSSEGMEASEIAKKLGIGKGEVDLVLGLFKRKYS